MLYFAYNDHLMPPFNAYIPTMPSSVGEIFLILGAFLGIILLVYAVFIEQEHRQDIVRMLGAGGLLVYAIYIQNTVFTIAMAAVALASAVEFVEILLGLHKHGQEDLKKYKKMWKLK